MTITAPAPGRLRPHLSRRALLGYGLGTAALWGLRPIAGAASAASPTAPETWRTWLLSSAAELRPAAPGRPSAAEIDELLALQAQRNAWTGRVVARWDTGPAVLPWTRLALDLIETHKPSPVRAARALALLHVAVHDATLAALDAQAAYRRPLPATIVPRLEPLATSSRRSASFASEHAAVAGAAAAVLTFVFPQQPAGVLAGLEAEAATSRLQAGAAFRGDVQAGLAIGREIGARAVARAMSDGADAVWDGSRPAGTGLWEPTPPAFVEEPLDPLAGTWRPWVIGHGDRARPVPPPAWGSAAWEAQLAAVQEAVARRSPEQEAAVHYWAGGPGSATPAGIWTRLAEGLIARNGLGSARAARVLALTSVAVADAFVCCWDAKFAYWTARPITADPTLNVLIPTPPFPSYPSGHATISAAAATILAHLFPGDADRLAARAAEAKDSRLWAGIHFPIDNEKGASLGALVGGMVADIARTDGAA